MPLNNSVIKKNATAITITGGTDQTFTSNQKPVPNGIFLIDVGETDARVRSHITASVKDGVYTPNVGWTGSMHKVHLIIPQLLTSGEMFFNTWRLERKVHPELAAASAIGGNIAMAQLLANAGYANFWNFGNLS